MDGMISRNIARLMAASALATALGACDRGEGASAADHAVAEARADSSAAGYATGLSRRADSTHTDSAAVAPQPDSGARAVTTGATGQAKTKGPPTPITRMSSKPSASATARRLPAPRKAATSTAARGPVIVNDYLSYDADSRVATLRVAAGTIASGDGLDFNGTRSGAATVTIPRGWQVSVTFQNSDDELPHSAVVIPDIEPIPQDLPDPAFPGAATPQSAEGTPEESNDQMSFTASRVGRFLIACGVPGHAMGGQWMVLQVSPSASVPTYRP